MSDLTNEQLFTEHLDQSTLKVQLSRVLQEVFANPDRISLFFAEDYVQTTDGSTSNRAEFEEHVRHIARSVTSIRFEVLEIARQGETIADRHLVHVDYQDGRQATIEVYLFGTIFGGRLRRVDEVTRVVSGDKTLKDAASARA